MSIPQGIGIMLTDTTLSAHNLTIEYAIFRRELRELENVEEGDIVDRVLNRGTMEVYYTENKDAAKLARYVRNKSREILDQVLNITGDLLSVEELGQEMEEEMKDME